MLHTYVQQSPALMLIYLAANFLDLLCLSVRTNNLLHQQIVPRDLLQVNLKSSMCKVCLPLVVLKSDGLLKGGKKSAHY